MPIKCTGEAIFEITGPSLRRVTIESSELSWDSIDRSERQMGLEIQYEATVNILPEHDEGDEIQITWAAWEYPLGILNFTDIELPTGVRMVRNFNISVSETISVPDKLDKWDTRLCHLAQFVSDWSKDPKAKVGAVVASKRGGDVSIGYNGFPKGVEDSLDKLNDPTEKLETIVHAEVNALIAAGTRAIGGTLYVWGKPVCSRCAGVIIQAGVKRVVALDYRPVDPESKWSVSGKRSHQMFLEAGIQVEYYKLSSENPKILLASNGENPERLGDTT